jgi:hypothetical protein
MARLGRLAVDGVATSCRGLVGSVVRVGVGQGQQGLAAWDRLVGAGWGGQAYARLAGWLAAPRPRTLRRRCPVAAYLELAAVCPTTE